MKVLKPSQIGVLTRSFEHEQVFRLGVCAYAFIPLALPEEDGRPVLLSEVSLWKFVGEAMGAEGTLDAAIPKVRAEYVVHGSAYAPDGKPVPQFGVEAAVGGLRKKLRVSGDRVWIGQRPSDASPISSLRLWWHASYGGEGYARNPLGKGATDVVLQPDPERPGVKTRALPNIENPDALMLEPDRKPEPVGLGPIDVSWPQRASLAGTYDQHWLENLFPGFAKDIDWGIHNVAPADQQRAEQWRPGEAYRFINMHPERPVVEGTLPNVRARAFVVRGHRRGEPRLGYRDRNQRSRDVPAEGDGPGGLEEVELRLQTIWFFPNEERAVLAWTGAIDVAEEEAADIVQLMVGAEHDDAPKPRSHYQQVMAARLHAEYGVMASMRDSDLLPEHVGSLPDSSEEDPFGKLEGLALANAQRRREELYEAGCAHLESRGIDPQEFGLEAPAAAEEIPPLEELPAFIEAKRAEAEAAKAEAEAKSKELRQEVYARVDAASGALNITSEELQARAEVGQGPPTFTAEATKAKLESLAMQARAAGMVAGEIEELLDVPANYERWLEVEEKLRQSYRQTAHHQPPAPPMPEPLRDPTRARLQQALQAGENLETLNFTGANLQGVDLRGANLTGAFLESADLSGADLRQARLDDAVLAHATLTGTMLAGASLRRTNLGKAKLQDVTLDDAHLTGAILEGAQLHECRLRGANLSGASLRGVEMTDCDASRCEAPQIQWLMVQLRGVDFKGANLRQGAWIELDLRGSKFAGANLADATFVSCDLREVAFSEAFLVGARFVELCRLEDAVLVRADARRANLRGIPMMRADLRQATLDGADFTEADLAEAKLYRAVAKEVRFDVANLRGASLMAANLMGASLARATIEGADFRGANLYGADMARIRTDDQARFEEAMLVKVRVHPRLQRGPA